MNALHDPDGLALLMIALVGLVVFALVGLVIEHAIKRTDSHAERVRRTRAAMARDYAPKDEEWRKRIRNAALLIQLHGWQGPEGRKYPERTR